MKDTSIPTPKDVLGYDVGTSRKLPDWNEIADYFQQLASSSDRVEIEVLGETTLGKPYIAVSISSSENLARRDELRSTLERLWDPRGIEDDEVAELVETGRPTNFLLCSQHSSEIGACLMSMQLASDLARGADPDTLEILDNTVTVIVPSHNPDGHQMEVEWYRRWLDTEYEGQPMPWLYHHYVGHDNNRDWFMLTQKESRLYVALHNREHPQLVFDMHQMQRDGARFMVPPFIDPLDPNQDPVIQQGFADLGTYIASRMTAEGLEGVATNIIFDNYSPSLAYGNYHGSVDLLSEAASVRLATPVTVKEKEFNKGRGFDPSERTWNHPLPWKGGEWTLEQIVEYDRVAALAFIEHAARNRRQWLRNYYKINKRTISRSEPPYAYLIPDEQRDPVVTYELLDTLSTGLVEIKKASAPFIADDVRYPAGTYVILLEQPAGNYAKTLLEVQQYPDLRQWPDGPPKPPYDITGHTLGLQTGVRVVEVKREFEAELDIVVPQPPSGSIESDAGHGYLVSGTTNAMFIGMNRLLKAGHTVKLSVDPLPEFGMPTGSMIVPANPDPQEILGEVASEASIHIHSLPDEIEVDAVTQEKPRVGIYRSRNPNIDEGWMRWILEQYEFDYTTLHDADIKQGALNDSYDTILIPQQKASDIQDGIKEKNKFDEPYPPEYTGGIGTLGGEQLRKFAESGGTIVAIDSACDFVIDQLHLPVRNVVGDLKKDEFYCPGSLLRVIVDNTHPLGFGMERDHVAAFVNSPVYELVESGAGTVIARYAANNPTLSGWILGSKKLEGKPAIIDVSIGAGKAILIGFRVQFRAQARNTYRLLLNSLIAGTQAQSSLRKF